MRWVPCALLFASPTLFGADFLCLHQNQRHVGYIERTETTEGTRQVTRDTHVLFVRGARAEGDLRVVTEVVREDQLLIGATRDVFAGHVRDGVSGERIGDQWLWRIQRGKAETTETVAAIAEDGALQVARIDHPHRYFNPIDLETHTLSWRDGEWSDTDRRLVFRGFGDRLQPSHLVLFELPLTATACPPSEARQRRSTVNPVDGSAMTLPAVLDNDDLRGKLGYELVGVPGEPSLPQSREQRWQQRDTHLAVVVCRSCDGLADNALDPAWRLPNAYVDSDAPMIIDQARVLRRSTDLSTMHASRRFVKSHLWQDTDELGYASASQALADRRGNCSEHAVLLAALARANGIPARIAHGLVYFRGRRNARPSLQPHAWVQAFINGRWQSFDAGQDLGFSAGHLAITIGDGTPDAALTELSRWRGVTVRRVVRLD